MGLHADVVSGVKDTFALKPAGTTGQASSDPGLSCVTLLTQSM